MSGTCRICGYECAEYRDKNRGLLCDSCAEDTPEKVGRLEFDRAYWGKDAAEVPEGVKREFYADYRASTSTLEQYKERTTTIGV